MHTRCCLVGTTQKVIRRLFISALAQALDGVTLSSSGASHSQENERQPAQTRQNVL